MPSTSRVVHAAPGPTPTKMAAIPCPMSCEGRLERGRVADGDGDGHEAGELAQLERVVPGREVARRADLATGRGRGPRRVRRTAGRTGGRPRVSADTATGLPAAWISSIRRATRSSRMGCAYASASRRWTSSSDAVAMRSSRRSADPRSESGRPRGSGPPGRRVARAPRRTADRRRRPWPRRGRECARRMPAMSTARVDVGRLDRLGPGASETSSNP